MPHELDKTQLDDLVAYQKWEALKQLLDEAAAAIESGDVVIPTRHSYNKGVEKYEPIVGPDAFKLFRKGWEDRQKENEEEKLND